MTQFLPPNLLALFAPRDPIPYLPPTEKLPHEKKLTHNYHGFAQYVHLFEDPADTPAPVIPEYREERMERKKKEKAEQIAYKLEQEIALWDPQNIPEATTDPFKTLFVSRINYYTSESKLRREFESYGPIKSIRLVSSNKTEKPRGYAFIEYEHERDMHSAYKHADGKKLDGRRVLVDVERARTVKGWLPRRLGGGLGGTRRGGPDVNTRYSGRDENRRGGREEGGDRRSNRSRSRDRKRRRSGSRDRKKRSRSRERKRSRSRDRKRRRSRSKDRKRDRKGERPPGEGPDWEGVQVKQEPEDRGYEDNFFQGMNDEGFTAARVKEEGEDRKPKMNRIESTGSKEDDMDMEGVHAVNGLEYQ